MIRKHVFMAACLALLALLLGGGIALAANGYGLSFYGEKAESPAAGGVSAFSLGISPANNSWTLLGAQGFASRSLTAYAGEIHVIGGGGGHSAAGTFVLDATVGQAVAGEVHNAPMDLCSGFWCWGWVYSIHLPLIVRDN
jgi:hypothetical protein